MLHEPAFLRVDPDGLPPEWQEEHAALMRLWEAQIGFVHYAAKTAHDALAALAAVWAITEEDVAADVHACIYEPGDDAWGPTEDPTTLDAAHVVLNRVTRAITEHIDPNLFTRKD